MNTFITRNKATRTPVASPRNPTPAWLTPGANRQPQVRVASYRVTARLSPVLAEYGALVGRARETADVAAKSRVLALITRLYARGYTPPVRMLQTEAVLRAQLAKASGRGESAPAHTPVTRNGRALHY